MKTSTNNPRHKLFLNICQTKPLLPVQIQEPLTLGKKLSGVAGFTGCCLKSFKEWNSEIYKYENIEEQLRGYETFFSSIFIGVIKQVYHFFLDNYIIETKNNTQCCVMTFVSLVMYQCLVKVPDNCICHQLFPGPFLP